MAVEEGQISGSQDLLEPVFYRPESIGTDEIVEMVKHRAEGRLNWVVGAGSETIRRVVSRMYQRGHTGPLWEHLIR